MAGVLYQVIGTDSNGIPRTYGEGESLDIAESRCREESAEYVARRRDTGPLDGWRFESKGARGR